MAATSASQPGASVIGQALVDFSTQGLFPADNDVATAALRPETLPDAIRVLSDAKTALETEIQSIVHDTAGDVQAWIDNAKALQVAIARRKTLAGDILVRANDGDGVRSSEGGIRNAGGGQTTQLQTPAEAEAEAHAQFLTGELNYNLQVRYLLEAIHSVSRLLDDVEQAAAQRRILDALRLLERAWGALDAMPVSKSCRAMRLLDLRAFELKADVHRVFDHVWSALVRVQADERQATLTIHETRPDEPMSLSDAVIGLKAYKEVDRRMVELWHALDKAIVAPRTDLSQPRPSRPRIYVDGAELGIREHSPSENEAGRDGVAALFEDLDTMFSFFADKLPADLVQSISSVMMPELVARVIDVWLASSVPTSLDQMAAFEGTLQAAQGFCARLTDLHYTGFGRLQEWIESAPRVWLAKRKEAALNTVRNNVAKGLGKPLQVERIEKQMVSRSEGKELAAAPAAATGTTEQATDWDTAWSDEEDEEQEQDSRPAASTKASTSKSTATAKDDGDDGADAWAAWGDDDDAAAELEEEAAEEEAVPEPSEPKAAGKESPEDNNDDDDAADAWGWGDDDGGEDNDEPAEAKPPSPKKAKKEAPSTSTTKAPPAAPNEPHDTAIREMVMKEKYHISSMPGPVLDLITSILEDGVALTSGAYEGSSVSAAGAGLFSLPALALAMFRAVSPHSYAHDVGGSMYLYNDAMYLAERLGEVAAAWTDRLPPAAASMLRLDAEVAKLQGFASRAYGREMAVQKTVLRDLLGGDQNVLQESGGGGSSSRGYPSHQESDEDADDYVDAAVARVRSMAAAWEDVLAPSAWSQAVGALADAVAQKLIADVLDMPSISQDEAFSLANLIQKVTELDDLFRPPVDEGEGDASIPMTSQYAPNWLRLQYLSEVLQSNLREVRYLWMESELSLYFTAEEVVDLLRLSFEDNARSREVAREIAANPHPVDVSSAG
ncbi:centromere/kinetochore protein ZW10 [Sporothrix schenckii 1099-18]|uniref:Centromere/kinetochore protein ZW10 n=1 Tax=Sporothrix schenckii 1099-18 TaxID=1397361 RepID=A0A0F2M6H1_SPOSC|nr:centromere/kinetochore protein ZW10 [Sporothrix schenckii 1099-18]KJR83781.1 centromere/kinetochore protein ZW10 [Sporothrix schenckii 1099-18]